VKSDSKDKEFPYNYVNEILRLICNHKYDIILISSHKEVRYELWKNGLFYTLIYPNINLKLEYIDKYQKRGSSIDFIDKINNNWDKYINDCMHEIGCLRIELNSNQYLSDIFYI